MKKILWLTLPLLLAFAGKPGVMAQTNVSGTILSNTLWTVANGPYIVTGDLLVASGATLNLEPGLTVRFEPNTILAIEGNLVAQGTVTDSIFFISNQASPGPSSWRGIQVSGSVGGSANLDYAKVQHAGKAVSIFSTPNGNQVVLRNSLLNQNAQGVADLSGNQVVYRCSFKGNAEAVSNTALNLRRCSFQDNGLALSGNVGSVDSCTFAGSTIAASASSSGPIRHSLFLYNHIGLSQHQLSGNDSITNCQFAANDTALVIGTNLPTFLENELCENGVNIKVAVSSNLQIGRNCWCSTDSSAILGTLIDGRNTPGLGVLNIAGINSVCGVIGQVWPGDTDDDGLAQVRDLLHIGVAMGETGESRFSPNAGWQGQAGLPWDKNFGSGLNYKHADCDGDGEVTLADVNVIVNNYGQSHQKTAGHINTGGVPLYLEVPRTASTGDTIQVTLRLGDANYPATDVYGISLGLGFDLALIDLASAQENIQGCWLGNPGQNLIDLAVKDTKLNWAIVRDDHQDTLGYGRLGGITMIMIDDLNRVAPLDDVFEAYDLTLIDKFGNPIPVDFFIVPLEACAAFGVSICPVPANERMVVMLDTLSAQEVAVYDGNGQRMYHAEGDLEGNLEVNTSQYAPGIYYVQVRVTQGLLTKKVIIMK